MSDSIAELLVENFAVEAQKRWDAGSGDFLDLIMANYPSLNEKQREELTLALADIYPEEDEGE